MQVEVESADKLRVMFHRVQKRPLPAVIPEPAHTNVQTRSLERHQVTFDRYSFSYDLKKTGTDGSTRADRQSLSVMLLCANQLPVALKQPGSDHDGSGYETRPDGKINVLNTLKVVEIRLDLL